MIDKNSKPRQDARMQRRANRETTDNQEDLKTEVAKIPKVEQVEEIFGLSDQQEGLDRLRKFIAGEERSMAVSKRVTEPEAITLLVNRLVENGDIDPSGEESGGKLGLVTSIKLLGVGIGIPEEEEAINVSRILLKSLGEKGKLLVPVGIRDQIVDRYVSRDRVTMKAKLNIERENRENLMKQEMVKENVELNQKSDGEGENGEIQQQSSNIVKQELFKFMEGKEKLENIIDEISNASKGKTGWASNADREVVIDEILWAVKEQVKDPHGTDVVSIKHRKVEVSDKLLVLMDILVYFGKVKEFEAIREMILKRMGNNELAHPQYYRLKYMKEFKEACRLEDFHKIGQIKQAFLDEYVEQRKVEKRPKNLKDLGWDAGRVIQEYLVFLLGLNNGAELAHQEMKLCIRKYKMSFRVNAYEYIIRGYLMQGQVEQAVKLINKLLKKDNGGGGEDATFDKTDIEEVIPQLSQKSLISILRSLTEYYQSCPQNTDLADLIKMMYREVMSLPEVQNNYTKSKSVIVLAKIFSDDVDFVAEVFSNIMKSYQDPIVLLTSTFKEQWILDTAGIVLKGINVTDDVDATSDVKESRLKAGNTIQGLLATSTALSTDRDEWNASIIQNVILPNIHNKPELKKILVEKILEKKIYLTEATQLALFEAYDETQDSVLYTKFAARLYTNLTSLGLLNPTSDQAGSIKKEKLEYLQKLTSKDNQDEAALKVKEFVDSYAYRHIFNFSDQFYDKDRENTVVTVATLLQSRMPPTERINSDIKRYERIFETIEPKKDIYNVIRKVILPSNKDGDARYKGSDAGASVGSAVESKPLDRFQSATLEMLNVCNAQRSAIAMVQMYKEVYTKFMNMEKDVEKENENENENEAENDVLENKKHQNSSGSRRLFEIFAKEPMLLKSVYYSFSNIYSPKMKNDISTNKELLLVTEILDQLIFKFAVGLYRRNLISTFAALQLITHYLKATNRYFSLSVFYYYVYLKQNVAQVNNISSGDTNRIVGGSSNFTASVSALALGADFIKYPNGLKLVDLVLESSTNSVVNGNTSGNIDLLYIFNAPNFNLRRKFIINNYCSNKLNIINNKKNDSSVGLFSMLSPSKLGFLNIVSSNNTKFSRLSQFIINSIFNDYKHINRVNGLEPKFVGSVNDLYNRRVFGRPFIRAIAEMCKEVQQQKPQQTADGSGSGSGSGSGVVDNDELISILKHKLVCLHSVNFLEYFLVTVPFTSGQIIPLQTTSIWKYFDLFNAIITNFRKAKLYDCAYLFFNIDLPILYEALGVHKLVILDHQQDKSDAKLNKLVVPTSTKIRIVTIYSQLINCALEQNNISIAKLYFDLYRKNIVNNPLFTKHLDFRSQTPNTLNNIQSFNSSFLNTLTSLESSSTSSSSDHVPSLKSSFAAFNNKNVTQALPFPPNNPHPHQIHQPFLFINRKSSVCST
ncbi:hypothetical protein AX774_g6268 [Zancudomyces culisetae]|uniref:Uncharacterized protein n=1 Tax=Zancudomyces culisetae TaxID=1213189 RepID=A0A1R1PH27_ZANCU|nr:hypothetical protein AX774_g6268 [Zancudomyces culisetae]|eukprot:OMH80305.1 hypothetical protein AX774_g6268 [Zancudomyces culisetae]